MYSFYLALAFYTCDVLCVDIEITGDLTFDVKIRNYRQRLVDVDIPLRLSIGNTGGRQKRPHYGLRGAFPRGVEHVGGAANGTTPPPPPPTPGEQPATTEKTNVTSDTTLEANNKRETMDEQDDAGEGEEERAGKEEKKKSERKSQSKKHKKKQKTKTTTLRPTECPYRYPEPWEANTVLSNMMNKLTKLFVMMSRSLYEGVRARSSAEAARLRRFKVISARNHDSFDRIFANMSNEFKSNYNASRERLPGAGGGCAAQAAAGRAWRRLLQRAQETYRAAALRCVDLHLGPWLASRDGSLNAHLNSALSSVNKQLLRDVERIRSEQLRVLCKLYELC